MPSVIKLVLIVWTVSAVHLGTMAIVFRWLGAPLDEVAFGVGYRWMRLDVFGFPLSLRLIPLGGFVRLLPLEPAAGRRDGRDVIQDSPVAPGAPRPVTSALASLSACLALLGLAAAVLGVKPAAASLVRGLPQYLGGAVSPLTTGASLLLQLRRLLAHESFVVCLALVASKAVAFSLLPVPGLNGYAVLKVLLPWRDDSTPGWWRRIENAGFVLLFLSYGGWCLAAFSLLFG
jgi:membrane-associated protease RseP (regulator of RpoE activity)